MRQAGRFLPDYRAIRERHTLLDICRNPELCAEVTLLAVRRLGVDAAILFSDIMMPLIALGVPFAIEDGKGPIITRPVRAPADVAALRISPPEEVLPFVFDTIRLLRHSADCRVPLIGFAGAPFTLASYLIEGQSSRDFTRTKTLMYRHPNMWHDLMDRLTEITLAYLRAQIAAGVQAIQLFDSWVGCLAPSDYAEFVFPYSRRIFQGLASSGVPCIHFGTGTATLLPLMREAGGDVIGLDWHVPIDMGWAAIGYDRAIQGNLDPAILLGPFSRVREEVRRILDAVGNRPGHIFNLGHGILPHTPVDTVKRLVEFVHEYSQRYYRGCPPSGLRDANTR